MILTHFLALVGLPPAVIAADAGLLPLASSAAPLSVGGGGSAAPPASIVVRTRAPVLPVRQP